MGEPTGLFPFDDRMAQGAAELEMRIKREFPTVTEIEFGWLNDKATRLEDAQWWARCRMVIRRGDERGQESYTVDDCWTPNEALAMLHTRLSYRFVPADPQTGKIMRDSPLVTDARMEPAEKMSGRLPEKQPGIHRWVAMATYTLTDGQARMAGVSGARVNLDSKNRLGVDIGCVDCEEPYGAVKNVRCPAEGFDWKYQ